MWLVGIVGVLVLGRCPSLGQWKLWVSWFGWFESLQHASRVIADWIQFYNHRRPHQALGMKTPAEAYALAA